jgi:N-acetylglutamate synthase-like GNAT family acetyltransferase
VKLEYLADHADAIATLAQWHYDHWKKISPELAVEDRIARFRGRIGRREVPTAFVAIVDEGVVGMACLVAHDMESRLALTPWLATVLVAPHYRSRGIGSALSEHVVEEARALGFLSMYLVTFDKMNFYARLGWNELEPTELHGLPATIMIRDLSL